MSLPFCVYVTNYHGSLQSTFQHIRIVVSSVQLVQDPTYLFHKVFFVFVSMHVQHRHAPLKSNSAPKFQVKHLCSKVQFALWKWRVNTFEVHVQVIFLKNFRVTKELLQKSILQLSKHHGVVATLEYRMFGQLQPTLCWSLGMPKPLKLVVSLPLVSPLSFFFSPPPQHLLDLFKGCLVSSN